MDRRGQMTQNIGQIVALLVLVAVGAFVTYEITGSFDPGSDSHAENAIEEVESKGETAFSLSTVLAIVLVAAIIIGVVITAIGGIGGGQQATTLRATKV